MISSYKGAILEIWRILTEAETEAEKHIDSEIREEIYHRAVEECIYIKKYYFGPYSKPKVVDPGEWHSIFDEDKKT